MIGSHLNRRAFGIETLSFFVLASACSMPARMPLGALPLERVGIYGEDGALAVLYEDDGGLWLRHQGQTVPLWQIDGGLAGPGIRVAFGVNEALDLNGTRMKRRFLGAEARQTIRSQVDADPAALRRRALAASPPVELRPARTPDLVPLAGAGLTFDIAYASPDNFMGMPIYERPGAFLEREVAEALYRVADDLAPMGFGLVIHDAYRPWFATWMFWEATPPGLRAYVADPAKGSRHNRGCAVDLSLTSLASGRPVDMPSAYDDFSIQAHADFVGGTERQRRHRDLLRRAMGRRGFSVYPTEWWHFDYHGWEAFPISNVTFSQLCEERPCPQFPEAGPASGET